MRTFTECDKREQVERLTALRDQILTTGPEHYSQRNWFLTENDIIESTSSGLEIACDGINLSACGTTACFAGHGAVAMVNAGFKNTIWPEHVTAYFDIPQDAFTASVGMGWGDVKLGDGRTMLQVFRTYFNNIDDVGDKAQQLAEWHTALDYLADRIKDIEG